MKLKEKIYMNQPKAFKEQENKPGLQVYQIFLLSKVDTQVLVQNI